MPKYANRPRDLRIVVDAEPKPLPKVRQPKPGWELKPGSSAAFRRGCKCYTLPGLASEGRDEHQAQCPLRQPRKEGPETTNE